MKRTVLLVTAATFAFLAGAGGAQQRLPQAVNQAGQTVNADPGAVVIAPAGGAAGKGRPLAEDAGLPVQGRNLTTHLKCVVGLDDNCTTSPNSTFSGSVSITGNLPDTAAGDLAATRSGIASVNTALGTSNTALAAIQAGIAATQATVAGLVGQVVYLHDPVSGGAVSFSDLHAVNLALSSALSSSITVPLDGSMATTRGYLSGAAGGVQVTIEGSADPDAATPHWSNVALFQNETAISSSILTQDGPFRFATQGYKQWRARVSTAGTGTMTLSYTISTAPTYMNTVIQPPPTALTAAASSSDGAAHTLFAAPGAGLVNKLTGLQCTNSNATTDSELTLNTVNGEHWSVAHNSGGFGWKFDPPLVGAVNTAITFTMNPAVSTTDCAAQGYKANP